MKMTKKSKKILKSWGCETVTDLADRMDTIDSGDRGSWGGNLTDIIYDVMNLSDTEQTIFIESYLARRRISITRWMFETPQ